MRISAEVVGVGAETLPKEGIKVFSLFGWLVADSWCWFVLREEYC
jgi:hypothetical protein